MASATSLSKILKQLDKVWKTAETKEVGGSFWKPPEGGHVVRLTNMAVELSRASERLQVVYSLKIVGGEYEGKTFKKFDGIETEENMAWLKGALTLIGVNLPTKISKLPDAIAEFYEENPDGILLEISVTTDGEYQKIYFNAVAEEPETEKEAEKEEDEEEEEGAPSKDEDEDEDDDGEENVEEILEEMSLEELLDYAEEEGIEIPKLSKKSKAKVKKAILKNL